MSPLALVAAPLAALLGFQRPSRREALLALALAGIVVWSVTGPSDSYARFERSWVFLLTGGLVVALAVRPPSGFGIVTTALAALTLATLAAAGLLWGTEYSWEELRWAADRHFGEQVRLVVGALATMASRGAADAATGGGSAFITAFEDSALAMVKFMKDVVPGLVMLQSLAAVAFAWAVYHRLARHPEGAPLPSLQEFRFNDHLIWGAILALVGLVWPGLSWAETIGGNLAVFFGGLYLTRGLGVALAVATAGGMTGPGATIIGVLATLFLAPIVMLVTVTLGLTDTWIDWRRMVRAAKSGT